jgi:hypothetical protein
LVLIVLSFAVAGTWSACIRRVNRILAKTPIAIRIKPAMTIRTALVLLVK